ncbi:DUF6325 family protein [Kitasatospora sp. NPDC059571]|uniref:DUF6325 family protein n=1 Tax=Kitasatospora sp. NPDC059571 TaxID=3346871 RepID=UPI0036761ACE
MGPIDYVVIEFPGNHMTGEGLPLLVDLVDRGIIRILDLTFVRKDLDGSVTAVELADMTGDGELDLAIFEGAGSGLLDDEDIGEAAANHHPANPAAEIVNTNRGAARSAPARRRGGARLVASGRIPVNEILQALDATETDAV